MGADGHDLIELAPLLAPLLPQTLFIAPDAPEPCDLAPFGRQWFSLQDRRPAVILAGARRTAPLLDAYLDELLQRGQRRYEVQLGGVSEATRAVLAEHGTLKPQGASWVISLSGEDSVEPLLRAALDGGARVEAVVPHRETLENYFVRDAAHRDATRAEGPTP